MRQLIKPLIHDLSNYILDTVFPKYCFGCGSEDEYLCGQCLNLMKPAIPANDFPVQKITPLDYHDPILARAIISGKYKFLPDVFKALAEHTTNRLVTNLQHLPQNDIILCPIPLAKSRLRWRGFNQAEIICTAISEQTGWPVVPLIKRIRNTAIQKDLDKNARQKNVANCFQMTETVPDRAIIILIDDVITTGATMLEAVNTIRQKYQNNIICFAIAAD